MIGIWNRIGWVQNESLGFSNCTHEMNKDMRLEKRSKAYVYSRIEIPQGVCSLSFDEYIWKFQKYYFKFLKSDFDSLIAYLVVRAHVSVWSGKFTIWIANSVIRSVIHRWPNIRLFSIQFYNFAFTIIIVASHTLVKDKVTSWVRYVFLQQIMKRFSRRILYEVICCIYLWSLFAPHWMGRNSSRPSELSPRWDWTRPSLI